MRYVLFLALIVLSGCGVVKGSDSEQVQAAIEMVDDAWIEDNAVEEFLEEMVEEFTGAKTDFSPCSPEEK